MLENTQETGALHARGDDPSLDIPLIQVEEVRADLRRESQRVRAGENLRLVREDGGITELEVSVLRHGRRTQICAASLHDICDSGLGLAISERLEVGELVTLCVTCEEEPDPLFAEEIRVVNACRRYDENGGGSFICGFELDGCAQSRLYKAVLDTLYLRTREMLAA